MATNGMTVNAKITRGELIDLMAACTNLAFDRSLDEESRKKWSDLHDKLRSQLVEFNAKRADR